MKFALLVTQRWNLGCEYCYVGKRPGRMSLGLAQKIVDFAYRAAAALLLLLATTATSLFAGTPQSSVLEGYRPMPTQFEGYSNNEPQFVAADTLSDDSGKLDLSSLDGNASLTIESMLSHPSADKGCLDYWTSYEDVDDEPRTLASALHKAPNVLIGTVTGSQPGFLDLTLPGTLLRVEIDEVLRGLYMEEAFTFYPVGDFRIGEIDVCKKNPFYPQLPTPGEQVVLLFDKIGLHNVILVGGDGIVTLKKDGTVSLSRLFKEKEPELETLKSWELLEVLRSTISVEAGK